MFCKINFRLIALVLWCGGNIIINNFETNIVINTKICSFKIINNTSFIYKLQYRSAEKKRTTAGVNNK